MRFYRWMLTACALIIVWLPASAGASGFGIFTQGASSLGQASAVVAHGDDPTAIFFNPALINKLPGTQLEIGTTLLLPSREFTSSSSGLHAHTKDAVFFPSTLFITHQFSDRLSAGLGVFSPFGLGTDWGETWEGRYLATRSEMISLNINPVVSYRITPQLAVAAGLDVLYLDTSLERIYFPANSGMKFNGDGTGIGFNIGVAYDVTPQLALGVSYRSEIKVGVRGSLQIQNVMSTGAKTDMTLPQQVFAGLCYKGFEPLTLEAGIRWEDWSSFKRLQIKLDNGLPFPPEEKNWKSTFAYNIGAQYKLNETVSLLAGYLYGDNPIPDSTFEPAIPDADTHLFCVGTDLDYRKFRVSLSYAYQLLEDRTKTGSVFADGRYSSDIHMFSASLTYKF